MAGYSQTFDAPDGVALRPAQLLRAAQTAPVAPTPVSLQAPAPPADQATEGIPTAPLAPPVVKAASALLMDAATGTVLWERNAHQKRPNASTTKIMTATLMLESGRMDDELTFSDRARKTPYANLHAMPGEKFTMNELLYAILMRSSNDSCVAVAEHLAGSPAAFAQQMTAKAHAIGAADTNFVTVNGLYEPKHYSTAFDLATMTRYAFHLPMFNEAVGTQKKIIERTKNTKDTLLENHNKFLEKYPGADGVKTGYVRQSGKCLVASATLDEGGSPWRLIAVVLNSSDHYGDSARLMDWGRTNFQPVFFARRGESLGDVRVSGGVTARVPLVAADDLAAVVRRGSGINMDREVRLDRTVPAPVREAQVGGKVIGLINGRPVAEVALIASRPVSQVWTASMAPWTGWSMLLAALLLGPRYARTFAKGTRRRRRRFASGRGDADHQWQGNG